MRILRIAGVVLAFVLLAAHFSRAGSDLVAGLMLVLPLLMAVPRPWAGWVLRLLLVLGALEWVRTLIRLVGERREAGEDWLRLAIILAAVAAVTLLAARGVRIRRPRAEPAATDAA